MDEIDRIDRAARSQQLLSDPLFSGAIKAVEDHLVASLKQSAIGDYDTHHNLTLSLQLLGSIERQLRNWIADGEIEKTKAKQQEAFNIKDWRKLIA
jgi:hypothetical protein